MTIQHLDADGLTVVLLPAPPVWYPGSPEDGLDPRLELTHLAGAPSPALERQLSEARRANEAGRADQPTHLGDAARPGGSARFDGAAHGNEARANESARLTEATDFRPAATESAAYGRVAVRDAQHPTGPALLFSLPAWNALIGGGPNLVDLR